MNIFGLFTISIIAMGLRVPCASSLEVRLVGGPDMYRGRVEVRYEGDWGTICDDEWDILDAKVVCRMLGFGNATAAYGYASFGEGNGSIFLDNVQCNGMESDIGYCRHNGFENHNCQHAEDAGVDCEPPVRLVGGQTELEGRVELFFNGSWGTVCDDDWDTRDASVFCRMLGYKGALRAPRGATYGAGSGPIVLDNVYCDGNERTLTECYHTGLGVHNCNHGEDAGVVCYNEDIPIRLVDGQTDLEGRVELFFNGSWGTVCDRYWDIKEARVVCRMLGFKAALGAPRRATYGEGSGFIVLDFVRCSGYERTLLDCNHNGFGVRKCNHGEDAGVVCYNEDIQVRLVGGQNELEGRVELFFNGSWGTVCDYYWDIQEARVVCRMLGFKGALSAPGGATYGAGSGPIELDNVICYGSERTLLDCYHGGFGVHNCYHGRDAGVVCYNGSLHSTPSSVADTVSREPMQSTTLSSVADTVSQEPNTNNYSFPPLDSKDRGSLHSTPSSVADSVSREPIRSATSVSVPDNVAREPIHAATSSSVPDNVSREPMQSTTSSSVADTVSQDPNTNNCSFPPLDSNRHIYLHTSVALATILGVSYVVFGLYVCWHRRRHQERKKQADSSSKVDQTELEYMDLVNTANADGV